MNTTKIYVIDGSGQKYNYYEVPGTLKSNPFIESMLQSHFNHFEHPITINVL